MTKIGVIGLGEMGLPMARRLRGAGFSVVGFDVRPEAGRELAASGAEIVASAGDVAARADMTIVLVRTPAQAESVVLGENGVLDRARQAALLAVMSTVGLPSIRRLADATRRRGLRFLDAPVSGGRERAEAGTLTIIVGAADADLEAARPALTAMGSRLAHVGDVGAGTAVKVANQVLLTASLLAAREAASLIATAGVPAETAWDVIRTCTGTTWPIEHWPIASAWIERYRPGSSLDILVKDTGIAVEMAREAQVPAPMLGLIAQLIVGLTRNLAAPGGAPT